MVPTGGMERRACKGIQAGNIWPCWLIQLAGSGNNDIGCLRLSVGSGDGPGVGGFVENRAGDFVIKLNMPRQIIFLNAVLHIIKNFRLQSELS